MPLAPPPARSHAIPRRVPGAAMLVFMAAALAGCASHGGGGSASTAAPAAGGSGTRAQLAVAIRSTGAVAIDQPVDFAVDVANTGATAAPALTLALDVRYLGHGAHSGAPGPMRPAWLPEDVA